MTRVQFRLSMPSCGSWNGKWSGEGRNYSIAHNMTDKGADALMGGMLVRTWSHRWEDGWCANISARIVPRGERLKKSDGFSGYDWMISNIIDHGDTRDKDELAKAVQP